MTSVTDPQSMETLRRRNTGQDNTEQRRRSFQDRLQETVLRRNSDPKTENQPKISDDGETADNDVQSAALKGNPQMIVPQSKITDENSPPVNLSELNDALAGTIDRPLEIRSDKLGSEKSSDSKLSSRDSDANSPQKSDVPKAAENLVESFPNASLMTKASSALDIISDSNVAAKPVLQSDTPVKEKSILVTPIGTSFDVADAKRDADFHLLFPDLDKKERLVEDYTCSWISDSMLVHGRLYITDSSLCFNAKVIWTYSVTIPFSSIKLVEKKTFVGIFPNALEVLTFEKKYYFASFLSRNQCFVQITEMLLGYPQNVISLVPVTATIPDLTRQPSIAAELPRRRVSSQPIQGKSTASLRTLSLSKQAETGLATIVHEEVRSGTDSPEHIVHQKHNVIPPTAEELDKRDVSKPVKFEPFECDCMPIHNSQKIVMDRTVPFELNELFHLVYNKNEFTLDYLKLQKYENVGISNWMPADYKFTKSDLDTTIAKESPKQKHKRRLEYVIPVNNPLGPKQSKCIVMENIVNQSSKYSIINKANLLGNINHDP